MDRDARHVFHVTKIQAFMYICSPTCQTWCLFALHFLRTIHFVISSYQGNALRGLPNPILYIMIKSISPWILRAELAYCLCHREPWPSEDISQWYSGRSERNTEEFRWRWGHCVVSQSLYWLLPTSPSMSMLMPPSRGSWRAGSGSGLTGIARWRVRRTVRRIDASD